MKKNGFTLVELMAVIIILLIMGMIAIPLVENSINSGKDELYVAQIDSIKASLKKYSIENVNSYIKNSGETVYLSLYQLKIAGYVSLDISDPRTEKMIPNNMLLKVTKNDHGYSYDILETTGTKEYVALKDETTNIPIIENAKVKYYCGNDLTELENIINEYTIDKSSATKKYYDTNLDKEYDLSYLLEQNKDFRVVYKSGKAYSILNIFRGCE